MLEEVKKSEVLPPLSVGEMTLRLYAALNYSQNSALDLRRTGTAANTDTKLLIHGLFQKGRVLAQDGVERLVPGPFPGDDEAQKLRLRLRKERSRPILSSIREWALTQRGLPRSDFGKAVRYMLERWAKLTLFVENSLVYPDNNAAERALRGPVVGRKNHYGSRSKRGTEVAALFYTLC